MILDEKDDLDLLFSKLMAAVQLLRTTDRGIFQTCKYSHLVDEIMVEILSKLDSDSHEYDYK